MRQVLRLFRQMAEEPTPAMVHCGLAALKVAREAKWDDEQLVMAVFAMMLGGAAHEVACETFSI